MCSSDLNGSVVRCEATESASGGTHRQLLNTRAAFSIGTWKIRGVGDKEPVATSRRVGNELKELVSAQKTLNWSPALSLIDGMRGSVIPKPCCVVDVSIAAEGDVVRIEPLVTVVLFTKRNGIGQRENVWLI